MPSIRQLSFLVPSLNAIGIVSIVICSTVMGSTGLANAASANVSFGGYVPCGLETQKCQVESGVSYVFAETVGVEYIVQNTGANKAIIRPKIRRGIANGQPAASVVPVAQKLAPGESARFVILVPMNGQSRKRFEVCSNGKTGNDVACQNYIAISAK